jgi:hypothetical protein
MHRIGIMMTEFRTRDPDLTGPISTAESVIMQRKVIDGISIENTGAFLSHHGKPRIGYETGVWAGI